MITRSLTVSLIAGLMLLLSPVVVLAQLPPGITVSDTQTRIQDVEGLRLQLIQNTQDPSSKNVRFDILVLSQITSDRVQLRWELAGGAELVAGERSVNFVINPGSSHKYSILVKPRAVGAINVRAVVEAFQIDGTKLATASKTIGFDAAGEVFPREGNHELAKLTLVIRDVSLVLFIVLAVLGCGWWFLHRFSSWLNSSRT